MHIDMELTTSAGTHDISSYSDCKQQQIVPESIEDKNSEEWQKHKISHTMIGTTPKEKHKKERKKKSPSWPALAQLQTCQALYKFPWV